MSRQGIEKVALAEKERNEAHFNKHWHPEQSWVVHEPKDVHSYFQDEENYPNNDKGSCVQGERLTQIISVSVVILQNGANHCEKGDTHDTGDIDLEAETKACEIVFCDKPLETEKQNALYHQLAKCFAHNF